MRLQHFPTISIPVSVAIMATTTGAVLAQATNPPARDFGYYHGPGMMWGGGQWGGFGMLFGFFFMLIVIIGIIAAIVLVLRSLGLAGGSNARASSMQERTNALDILKERFAKGEIDAKEFDERKRLLSD